MKNIKCPIHSCLLIKKHTSYGVRYSCPIDGCTVAMWNGSTSTPATATNRRWRQKAHSHFDKLWKNRKQRNALYKKLSEYLGLPKQKTHIGYFDTDTCKKVIQFCNEGVVS